MPGPQTFQLHDPMDFSVCFSQVVLCFLLFIVEVIIDVDVFIQASFLTCDSDPPTGDMKKR